MKELVLDPGEQISFCDSDWVLKPATNPWGYIPDMYMVDAPGAIVRYFSTFENALEQLKELSDRL